MSLKTMDDVLHHTLKDLLSAEKQFRDALPDLAEAAENRDLVRAFESHRTETETHVERLERCFELLGKPGRSEKCEAAEGLVEEGQGVIEEEGEPLFKDLTLAGSGRKVEHYEIVSYTDAVTYAEALGHDDVARLLTETLKEEKAADSKLQSIAQRLGAQARRAA